MTTRDLDRSAFDWGDYEHFRGFGWDHDRIARRLGVEPSSLQTALVRRAQRQSKNARTEAAA